MNISKITKSVFAFMLAFGVTTTTQAQYDTMNKKDVVDLAVETEALSTLVTAVQAADLAETLKGDGPFTVFAPTNEAFNSLPDGVLEMLLQPENKDKLAAVLTYHVVPAKVMSGDLSDDMKAQTVEGSEATINIVDGMAKVDGATVAIADIEASNGVVHVIDQVILPPSIKEALAKDIVDLAVETEELSTLVTAVQAADLVETLKSDGPFTVFAPTSEAFNALPEGVLEMLLQPENKDKLTAVLAYHVVPAKVMSGDLTDDMKAPTLEGSEATITIVDGMAKVDGATVAIADIEASNGVVHVIDQVILPPSIKEALSAAETSKDEMDGGYN
ncbi:MAG: fasciclin domain-containing protein [Balneolaceae bacterium]|nr:fasciclin domain-containing protein [Balneolaceae bacterium]MDR9447373.1 fasciclin domain-containing protein [Balneolaceae bacterium]